MADFRFVTLPINSRWMGNERFSKSALSEPVGCIAASCGQAPRLALLPAKRTKDPWRRNLWNSESDWVSSLQDANLWKMRGNTPQTKNPGILAFGPFRSALGPLLAEDVVGTMPRIVKRADN